jgi:cellulose synthase/poly-beta-1,6-N-acetylglucosamine synthase-like glycosyltransferase
VIETTGVYWTLSILFWTAAIAVIYPYVLYPPLLAFLAAVKPRPLKPQPGAEEPSVTIIISAYNEEGALRAKLENTLALVYPANKLEIIVASDASSDATDEIVREFSAREPRVRLLRQAERRGKSAALNAAVTAARGNIVVFSDANAVYEPQAIRELVSAFADPQVGYVVGAAHYADSGGKAAAENEGVYWKLELFLKMLESRFDSVVGGDGAIYALRRELFRPLKDDDISDFVNPLQVIAAGYRGVFNPNARCFENAGDTVAHEVKRKRRIVNRSWRAFLRHGTSFFAFRHASFLFLLLSHKVIRWFAAPLIVVAWLTSLMLAPRAIYAFAWLTINASLLFAAYGALAEKRGVVAPRLVSIIHYFYVINVAGFLGIWDQWRGVRHVTWDHIRKVER